MSDLPPPQTKLFPHILPLFLDSFMHRLTIWIVILGAMVASWGCGGTHESAHDSQALAGTVDPTLPKEAQAQQDAMLRLLATIQRGVAFEYLPDEAKGVVMEESQADFFGSTCDLHRWEFIGAPDQNKVTLKMIFRLDQPDFPEQEEQRTYLVIPKGNQFIVRRTQ